MKSVLIFTVTLLLYIIQIDGSTLRVVGGYDAPPNYSKFHASLQNLDGNHVCGGAVISKQHILTAAHCVYGAKPEYIQAVVGTTNLKDDGGKQYNISTIHIHNKFDVGLKWNDVAILTIKGYFDMSIVEILKIHKQAIEEGDEVILTGFGSQEPNGKTGPQLLALDLKVFSQETCKYAMRNTREVYDEMFCTFTTIGEGTCNGDSGGPLVKDNELVGVVSWGIPCAVGFPDVHTRITPYISWIEEIIKKRNTCRSKLSIPISVPFYPSKHLEQIRL